MTADLRNLVVEILHNRGDDDHPDWSVGSGFFVGTRLVLTALHNVDGQGELLVRVHGKEEHPAIVSLKGDKDMDLAVLEISDVAVDVPPLRYGAVDRSVAAVVERCWAIGYPRLKVLGHERGKPKPPPSSAHVNGEIPTGEYLGQQLLTLQVRNSPRPQPQGSEWEGMSGAVVFSGDYIVVGVITDHHLPEGESALTIVPITALDLLPEAEATKWWKLLGMDHQALVRLPGEAPSSLSHSARPKSFIPHSPSPLFQPRPREFEHLKGMLFESKREKLPPRVGLVGMGGVGKTQLAVELADRCIDRYPGGVFWMSAADKDIVDWQRQLAALAVDTDYLPPDDNLSSPENERRRARYLCRYLADHQDALLILDNVEDPSLVMTVLPALAGGKVTCSMLYTSRVTHVPAGFVAYRVDKLPQEAAHRLLLDSTRPALLTEILQGSHSEEAQAARTMCDIVGYLPLALVHLRSLLDVDQDMLLTALLAELRERGALEIANDVDPDAASLITTFRLSWEKVKEAEAQRLFKLAAYFPEAAPIPLWLLGLAAGLGEKIEGFTPLGRIWIRLQRLSLVEKLSKDQVQLHPLVRAFGQRLVAEDGDKGQVLLHEAAERLTSEFTHLNKLEQRALRGGYSTCLEQVRTVYKYVELLGTTTQAEQVSRIERWLGRESYLLGSARWWPHQLPGLFYQQLYNHALEEGYTLSKKGETNAPWVRQLSRVGAEEHALIREFRSGGNLGSITSVAYAPDGSCTVIGCTDTCIWDVNTGQILRHLNEYHGPVTSVAFSPDGGKIVTCCSSSDKGVSLWDVMSGQKVRMFPEELSAQDSAQKSLDRIVHPTNLALPDPSTNLEKVVFSLDGKKIATASKDGTVYIWDIASGEMLAILTGHTDSLTNIAFSPDGTQVVTSTNGEAFLWDVASKQVSVELTEYIDDPDYVAFLPDGKLLLAAWNEIRVYTIESGQITERFEQQTIETTGGFRCMALSPDGKQIALHSNLFLFPPDNTVYIWNREQRTMRAMLSGHTDEITEVCFSQSGEQVLTSSKDGTAKIWSLSRSARTVEMGVSRDFIRHIAFFPGGKRAVTASSDGIVQLWDGVNGQVLATMKEHPSESPILTLTCNPLAEGVMLAFADRSIAGWEIPLDNVFVIPDFLKEKVKDLCFSSDGNKIGALLWDSGAISIWDLLAEKGTTLQGHKGYRGYIVCFAFSPDGSKIVAGGNDGAVFVWDTETYSLLQHNSTGDSMITSVCISPDNNRVAIASSYGSISIWSMQEWRLVRFANLLGGSSDTINHMSFSPDGMLFLAADERGQICLWKVHQKGDTHLLGTYSTVNKIGAICWQEAHRVVLADMGNWQGRPYFYQLTLEGEW